jgi:hypothetical protein
MKISHCVLQANASMIEPMAAEQFAKVFQIKRHKGFLHQTIEAGSEATDSGLRRWQKSVDNRGCVVNEICSTSSFMHII